MKSITNKMAEKFLKEFIPLKLFGKQNAIYRIKMQPFFGKPLFNNKCETLTFKRPQEYRS